MSYYRPKWLTYIGAFCSIIASFSWPLYGFIYCKMLFVMMSREIPGYDYESNRNFWMGLFLLLVVMIGVFTVITKYIYVHAGENLTFDIRNLLYKGIIYKHLAWFDGKDRAPGVLSNILSEEIAALNGMTTEHLGILFEAYGGLIVGVFLAMFFTWRMGLVTLAACPLVSLGGVMMSRLQWKVKRQSSGAKTEEEKNDPYQMSNALLSDILMNYRTVIGFGHKNVDFLLTKFDALLEEPNR